MRNLTVRRSKSFVACLAKMKLYIEDSENAEITINDIPCRKLGVLKNGEEKAFQIPDYACKVFVITDKLSKGYCSEYYQIPEGQEDIFLSGKNKYNPAAGNPFRFDHNNSEGIEAHRKRGARKGLVILAVVLVVCFALGFAAPTLLNRESNAKAKTFSSDGMTITLTEAFKKSSTDDFTVMYASKDVGVSAIQYSYGPGSVGEMLTPRQYAEELIASGIDAEVKTADGLTYFTYKLTERESKKLIRYTAYVYKTDDAFWLVQFGVLDKNFDDYDEQIVKWAKSVKFD